MGGLLSYHHSYNSRDRNDNEVERGNELNDLNELRRSGVDDAGSYSFPPPNGGLYFGPRFVLGGQMFASTSPQSFLFGPLTDLNYLNRSSGGMDLNPPMLPPIPNVTHATTVRCDLNLHKESLQLVPSKAHPGEWSVEFTFDAVIPCRILVYFWCIEVASASGNAVFKSLSSSLALEPVIMEAGFSQHYRDPDKTLRLTDIPDEAFVFESDAEIRAGEVRRYPLVVLLEALHPDDNDADVIKETVSSSRKKSVNNAKFVQSQATIAVLDRTVTRTIVVDEEERLSNAMTSQELVGQNTEDVNDKLPGAINARAVKQKITVQGVTYMLQEIYGMENKNIETERNVTDDDNMVECVVCMAERRDTMVLPCRHLCLCNICAEVLRFQSNKCPICRAPFHALLQIRVASQNTDESYPIVEAILGQSDGDTVDVFVSNDVVPTTAEASGSLSISSVVPMNATTVSTTDDEKNNICTNEKPELCNDPILDEYTISNEELVAASRDSVGTRSCNNYIHDDPNLCNMPAIVDDDILTNEELREKVSGDPEGAGSHNIYVCDEPDAVAQLLNDHAFDDDILTNEELREKVSRHSGAEHHNNYIYDDVSSAESPNIKKSEVLESSIELPGTPSYDNSDMVESTEVVNNDDEEGLAAES